MNFCLGRKPSFQPQHGTVILHKTDLLLTGPGKALSEGPNCAVPLQAATVAVVGGMIGWMVWVRRPFLFTPILLVPTSCVVGEVSGDPGGGDKHGRLGRMQYNRKRMPYDNQIYHAWLAVQAAQSDDPVKFVNHPHVRRTTDFQSVAYVCLAFCFWGFTCSVTRDYL